MSNLHLCNINRNSYVSLIYLLKKQVKKFCKYFCGLVWNTYGAPFKEHWSPRSSMTNYHERSFIVFIHHHQCIVKRIKPMTKYLSSLLMIKYLPSLIKLITINYKFLSTTNRLATLCHIDSLINRFSFLTFEKGSVLIMLPAVW